jgi:uncharacterized protein YcbK (DUF882 family)
MRIFSRFAAVFSDFVLALDRLLVNLRRLPMQRTRTQVLALTFSLTFALAVPSLAQAQPDSEDSGDETQAPDTASARPSKRSAPAKKQRRRKSKVVGHVVPDSQLRTTPLPAPSGHVQLHGLASNEDVDLEIFNDDGSYDVEEMKEADHILRCKRTDSEKPIDPRLVALLSHIYDHFGKRIDIVSGFRNQRKQTSFHFKGAASDIRIEGVTPKKIVQFASTLDTGGMGIGLYPRSKFVHIDVRPAPSYRWIDNARPNPNSPDKRPPRGWKRKKLQS